MYYNIGHTESIILLLLICLTAKSDSVRAERVGSCNQRPINPGVRAARRLPHPGSRPSTASSAVFEQHSRCRHLISPSGDVRFEIMMCPQNKLVTINDIYIQACLSADLC